MMNESKELAYIIGMYLTDGYIMFRESKEHFRAFCVDTTFKEVSDACNSYLKNIEIANTVKKRSVKTVTGKDIYRLYCPDKTLAKYLYTQSENKKHIPKDVFSYSIESKIYFIAGIIDGDGNVNPEGCITISNTKLWIAEFEKFIRDIGIRTNGLRIDRWLENDKPYYRINVRRMDYVKLNGFCNIQDKNYRIYNAKDTRKR